jgi:hypothetical protein
MAARLAADPLRREPLHHMVAVTPPRTVAQITIRPCRRPLRPIQTHSPDRKTAILPRTEPSNAVRRIVVSGVRWRPNTSAPRVRPQSVTATRRPATSPLTCGLIEAHRREVALQRGLECPHADRSWRTPPQVQGVALARGTTGIHTGWRPTQTGTRQARMLRRVNTGTRRPNRRDIPLGTHALG